MTKFNEAYLTGKEESYIRDVFDRKQFYGNGYYTDKCQSLIGERICVENVLLTDSCTSALEMSALLLRDWEEIQEIIVPSYTFSSTAAAFARAGFKIVFAEIDPKTMMVDFDDVKSKISSRTAAVVVVHYGGFGAKTKLFKRLCEDNSIYLIEDAAQAFGCVDDGQHLGSFGDLGCYSFHETKNLHAGLSGALVINNTKFMDRAWHIRERGTNRKEVLKGLADKYSWVEIGGSFYPTELQAAFLCAQLESFEDNASQRKSVFFGYYDVFEANYISDVYYPRICDDFVTNFHAFWLIFATEEECDFVRSKLVESDISAYIGYVPLHSSPVGISLGYKPNDLVLTEEYSKRILRLPLHNKMSPEEARSIAALTIQYIQEHRR
jgi:dTDP-4-amino-4,6-dideoxygalactose transaminase